MKIDSWSERACQCLPPSPQSVSASPTSPDCLQLGCQYSTVQSVSASPTSTDWLQLGVSTVSTVQYSQSVPPPLSLTDYSWVSDCTFLPHTSTLTTNYPVIQPCGFFNLSPTNLNQYSSNLLSPWFWHFYSIPVFLVKTQTSCHHDVDTSSSYQYF